jgi:hypothetical protein
VSLDLRAFGKCRCDKFAKIEDFGGLGVYFTLSEIYVREERQLVLTVVSHVLQTWLGKYFSGLGTFAQNPKLFRIRWTRHFHCVLRRGGGIFPFMCSANSCLGSQQTEAFMVSHISPETSEIGT